jgi:hypothetical protein
MGRKASQVLLVNFALGFGTWIGIKFADLLFWNDEVKYRVWEETETQFWIKHGTPKVMEPKVEFESVNNPGKIFRSYLPPSGQTSFDEMIEKYQV